MRMWFLRNPPARATIEILNVNSFSWLNTSQSPELQDAPTKEYHSKGDHSSFPNMRYRNPKYLSTLNHLRFYLPQVFPELDKVLFLDDDVVVQQDLAPLWAVDLHGNVNGAVEICEGSFHRFDKYLNFSNPQIRDNFDPHACGWAYGMNIFDLRQWKKKGITNIYNQWQSMVSNLSFEHI
jgi:alpha-1,4-galacturonosyltransferase